MFGLDPTVTAGLLAIAGTIVGAFVGSFLGLRRHRKETNWELKQQTYIDLVLSLQQMRDYYGDVYDDAVGNKSYTEKYMRQRRRQNDSAREMFQRVRALAFVLLGSDISELLDELDRSIRYDEYSSLGEWADACYGEVDRALKAIRQEAAAELTA